MTVTVSSAQVALVAVDRLAGLLGEITTLAGHQIDESQAQGAVDA